MENPIRKHLSIHLDDYGRTVLATFTPGDTAGTITLDDLKQAISDAGFGHFKLNEPALGKVVAKYNFGAAFELPIGETVDGKFEIKVDHERVTAILNLTPPRGGAPVQLESIFQEAAHKGIGIQLDLDAINHALIHGAEGVVIAQGKPPVHGINGTVQNLIPAISNRSPKLDESGVADFRDFGDIIVVQQGEVLMRRTPPTEGEPGIALSGKPIAARPGKEAAFAKKIQGAIIDPNDRNQLIASISGYPVQKMGEISIEPVYKVKNVDLRSGNINFDGTVHVGNDVHAGMTINATGDIHVGGTVEGALLEAGGNIVVKGGIIAVLEQGNNFTPLVKCEANCTARFIQNARVIAGQGIFIAEFTMQSDLTAGHQIIVGKKGGGKGHIIGGVLRAPMLIKAQNIGSETGVKTSLITGPDPALYEQLKAASKAREEVERKLADIHRLLALAGQNPARIAADAVKSAEATREAMAVELATLTEHEQNLQTRVDLMSNSRVIAEKKIYAGVEVQMGNKQQKIVTDREAGFFHMHEGELSFS